MPGGSTFFWIWCASLFYASQLSASLPSGSLPIYRAMLSHFSSLRIHCSPMSRPALRSKGCANLRQDTKCDAKEGIINAPVDNCDCDDLSGKCDLCGHSRLLDQPSGRNYQFTCDGPNSTCSGQRLPTCHFGSSFVGHRQND